MENFKDRLDHILRSKNLTAKKFAELMEIQPSNVSHLLNGRNKPSIDFLIKLKEVFPEYSFDWIIMGKKPITINDPTPIIAETQDLKFDEIEEEIPENETDIIKNIPEDIIKSNDNQEIEKILVIYKDNTFEILQQR